MYACVCVSLHSVILINNRVTILPLKPSLGTYMCISRWFHFCIHVCNFLVPIKYTFDMFSISAVCDDHDFKDDKLFYRFRKDDNTYEEPPDTLLLAKGQRIYSRLVTIVFM